MDQPDENYRGRVADAALRAIIDLYSDGTENSGFVEPQGAIDGLCLAIVMLARNTGDAGTPAARRALADRCRKQLIETGNAVAEAERRGIMPEWVAAKPVTRSS